MHHYTISIAVTLARPQMAVELLSTNHIGAPISQSGKVRERILAHVCGGQRNFYTKKIFTRQYVPSQ